MYILACTVIYSYCKYKKIQQYKMFTLITNYKHQPMVINNDRTKTVDNTSCLHSIATPSMIVSGIYKRNYYTCEVILRNIHTYRIQYISNMYKVACGKLNKIY